MIYRIYNDNELIDFAFNLENANRKYNDYLTMIDGRYISMSIQKEQDKFEKTIKTDSRY